MKVLDIHSHILPGVDDGAWDWREALQMAKMAADSGVSILVATPHCIPGKFDNFEGTYLRRQFSLLKERIKENKIPVQILTGMEVFVTEELPDLLWQKKVCTLNHTKYLLLEFDFGEPLFWCRKMLQNVTDMGYIPVIAHPERYDELQQAPWKVEEWLDMGCHIQVNKGSVLGRFGKSIARSADYLMKHNLVACVASDAHGCRQRTTDMRELQRYLTETYSEEYARMVLWENPAKICRGQALY